ncbi:FIVAR domain-containing protein [[Mycoplasma] imitans]|uniref:FIVAR domain-containing protein n=1 Tax=[Mycoplasma] imitans TaxID=29560 RepID=UPI000482C28B|nr:FIVAR domain-containing protein [[Mycoplasma] imitans]
MKRKNILKFISLLGVGSFVSLAVASCGQVDTPNPEEPKPTNPTQPDKPEDNAAKQLAEAKTKLTSLLNTKAQNVAKYQDYAKIQSSLTTAYTTAEGVSNKNDATLMNIQDATTALQSAIDKAASDKKTFDDQNSDLVTAYGQLKTTLQNQDATLETLTETKYSAIKSRLSDLYQIGTEITSKTLDPSMGDKPSVDSVKQANSDITTAISEDSLNKWKLNADKYNVFEKNALSKTALSATNDTTHNGEQPSNYSFVGYSNELATGTGAPTTLPNWNFAQRKVWTSETTANNGSTDIVESPNSKTDVSWIYSLSGEGTKYSLTFDYYGPSTAYLYFPYKLVKSADSSSVALQYKLNNGEQQPITFAADGQQNGEATANKTPTVSDINVAKVNLSGLKFGSNTIELSVPTETAAKVAPMIGNMYITSNAQNSDKIYNDIFGNTLNTNDNSKSVSVNLLTGYSLASGWSIYIGQFTQLTGQETMYLVGFIGGNNPRNANNTTTNNVSFPSTRGANRTFTIYVNAPEAGQYFISGSYLSGAKQARGLEFSTGIETNIVKINGLKENNWTTLGKFNTAEPTTTEDVNSADNTMHKTLTLVKGLNKIVIATGTTNGGDAPFIGNLTFTLSSEQN